MPRALNKYIDGAIPSGNSVAVNVLAMLNRREADYDDEIKAEQTVAAFYKQLSASPAAYSYMLIGLNKIVNAETGSQQYAAKGAVSIHGQIQTQNQQQSLIVTIKILPGWHINAAKPLDKDLLPTQLRLSKTSHWKLGVINFPKPIDKKLAFSQKPLALYEGSLQITAPVSRETDSTITMLPVELNLQACNQKSCLAPEVIKFKL